MSEFLPPFLYDPTQSFYDNLKNGPFGVSPADPPYTNSGNSSYDFFGTKVYSPFGIAAGPLPMAHFVDAAFNKGFDIVTFKSVRTSEHNCHPAPNTYPLRLDKLDPTQPHIPIQIKSEYEPPLTLANSFGVPSFDPKVWIPEIKKSFQGVQEGQFMMVAFQGTDRGEGPDAFIADHVKGVGLLRSCGARVIEINLSCPNEGATHFLCFNPVMVRKIITAVRAEYDDLKFVVKIAYFTDDDLLSRFVATVGPLVDGVTAINTIAAPVVTATGEPAFPNSPARLCPGVSGHGIKHLAIDMVKRLKTHRDNLGLGYIIIGVGGVQTASDFHEHIDAGADYVMALTGAMWNPNLAIEIKATL